MTNKQPTPTQTLSKDLRLDRIVTWVLTTLVGLGITIAILTYKDLKEEFKSLTQSIVALNTTVAVMANSQEQIEDNESAIKINQGEIQNLKLWQAAVEGHTP